MNDFLSKENTINIFKTISTSNNLTNLNKQQKDSLINQIITIMKRVFKTLELQKINKNNLPIVKKQYNDIIIKQASEFYKESNNQSKIINDRQNERTFNSVKKQVPIPGADRPGAFKSAAGQVLGNAPPTMSADFMKKATEDINTRLAEIENSRRATQEKTKPTELPDFLKPQKVGKTNTMMDMGLNKPNDSKPLLGFNDLPDSNFSSSVPSSDKSKYTEQLSTMDRLKQLEAERNMTVNAPVQNQRSDFNNVNTMFNNNTNTDGYNMFSAPPNTKNDYNIQHQMPPIHQQQVPQVHQQQMQPMPPIHQPQVPQVHQQQMQPMPQQQMQPMPPIHQQQVPQVHQQQKQPIQQIHQQQMPSMHQYQDLLNKMNEMQQTILMLKQENDFLMRDKLTNSNNETNKHFNTNQKKTFIEQLQLEISKKDSRYNYQFNQINNITNIKLISYDLPPALYNIIDDANIIYKINNAEGYISEKRMIVPKGNYNINNLLMKLNENDDLLFTTNIEEKIIIKCKDNQTPFTLIHNNFTNKLGFNDNNNFVLTLIADRIYDIRHINKLCLFIRNIYQDKPVGILNFNGSSVINLGFNNISLSNLLLEFYTEDNQLYNFNNMNYNLSFIIDINSE